MRADRIASLLLLLGLFGCRDPGAAPPPVAAGTKLAIRVPFELYGVPGPWWRDDATQSDFDRDMWTCRTESKRARDEASSESRKDVAYRAFIDCMTALTWRRGYPPAGEAG